jgi:hypothetical protein
MIRILTATITVLTSACLLSIPMMAQTSPLLISWQQDLSEASNPVALPDAPSSSEAYVSETQSKKTREVLAGDPYQPLTRHQKWGHFLHRTYA